MKSAIEAILKAHNVLSLFQTTVDYTVKIENEPFMALCIEKHGCMVSVTHYYEVNGDLVPDPDMEFEVKGDGTWMPVAIQQGDHYRRAVEIQNGRRLVNLAQFSSQKAFSNLWARNLIAQGFSKGKLVRAEAC